MIEWPIDKIGLINSALTQTGDNLVAIGNDSDEWRVCSPAYERGLAFALEDHAWNQATKVIANLPASPTPPADTLFDTAYPLPGDLLHLIWVRQDNRPALCYDLLAGQLVTKNIGSPGTVSIKYISIDNSDIDQATPTLVLALQTFVLSAIYRGLHENLSEANALYKEAQAILARARYTHDTQRPRRSLFNSRLRMARKIRRPWNTSWDQWGGTGTPGS